MYTFDNLEAIKNKFDNGSVKQSMRVKATKKIHLKKRVEKVEDLDSEQISFPKTKKEYNESKQVKKPEQKDDDEEEDKKQQEDDYKQQEEEDYKQQEEEEEEEEDDDK